jgi:hypothetical protein
VSFSLPKRSISRLEETLSSYLNERYQFDYVVSSMPVEGSGIHGRNWNQGYQCKLRLVAEVL